MSLHSFRQDALGRGLSVLAVLALRAMLAEEVVRFNIRMSMAPRAKEEYNANARPNTEGWVGSVRLWRPATRVAGIAMRLCCLIVSTMACAWPLPSINAQMRVGLREMAESGPFSRTGCRAVFIQPASVGESGGCLAVETGSVFGIAGLLDSGASLDIALDAGRGDSFWKGVAFGVSSVGFGPYQSLSAMSGVSAAVGGGAFGLSLRYAMQRFGGGYLDEHVVEMDAGWVADPLDRIRAGIAIQQLAEWHPGRGLGSPPPRSPIGVEPGIAWSPKGWLRLTGSAGFRSGRSPQMLAWNASAEWIPHNQILFGFSRRSDPALSVFSLRIAIQRGSLGMRSIIHPDLGMQHLAGLAWEWGR